MSSEWFHRPDDERYLSLDELWACVKGRSERSRSRVLQTADIRVEAARDGSDRLQLILPKDKKLLNLFVQNDIKDFAAAVFLSHELIFIQHMTGFAGGRAHWFAPGYRPRSAVPISR